LYSTEGALVFEEPTIEAIPAAIFSLRGLIQRPALAPLFLLLFTNGSHIFLTFRDFIFQENGGKTGEREEAPYIFPLQYFPIIWLFGYIVLCCIWLYCLLFGVLFLYDFPKYRFFICLYPKKSIRN
jgi:hypothetical protein